MKITCNNQELSKAVQTVSKSITNRTTMPILECVLLKASNNELSLTGNDMELGIKTKIKAKVEKEGTVAVDAKMFSDIVRKLPNGEVTIENDKNNLIKITCTNSEFTLSAQAGDEFPELPSIEKKEGISLNKLMIKKMIKETIFSVALEETKPILTGELFEIKDNTLKLVSCDGFRISYRKTNITNDNNKDIKIVIPGKTLGEISKIIEDEDENIEIYLNDNNILFDLGDTQVVSRLLEGNYFDYKQSFTSDYETKVTLDKNNLLKSIERAALIAKVNKKHHIKLDIKEDKINISSNTDIGSAFEEVVAEVKGNNLVIGFNPKYLIDVLKNIEDDKITLQFTSPLSPCIIANDNYKYLIMAVRLG